MSKSYGPYVTFVKDDQVAMVTIDRPQHNYLSVDVLKCLAEALEDADLDSDIRANVLATGGTTFSAGANFSPATDGPPSSTNEFYGTALRLFAVEKPIIVAVQGAAVGAGLGLAMIGDFRVAGPGARFVANFVKLGFHPGFGLSRTLPHVIGPQRAGLMLLTGRRIKADEALAWGLIDRLVDNDPKGYAAALAREIAENAPLAVRATRKTLRSGLMAHLEDIIGFEASEQQNLRKTYDFVEGVRAVAERRRGKFLGR